MCVINFLKEFKCDTFFFVFIVSISILMFIGFIVNNDRMWSKIVIFIGLITIVGIIESTKIQIKRIKDERKN